MVQEVDTILSTIKGNVTATMNILKAWEKNFMFDRKEGKVCMVKCVCVCVWFDRKEGKVCMVECVCVWFDRKEGKVCVCVCAYVRQVRFACLFVHCAL